MAATYPLEIVQAARWAKDNPTLGSERQVTGPVLRETIK
jgi:hypothetical protein